MERLEVKNQQRVFEELPGTLTLDIIMARRQDDKKKRKRDKRTAFFKKLDYGDQDLQESRL